MSGQRVRRLCRYTVAFVHCELMAQRQAAQAAGGSLAPSDFIYTIRSMGWSSEFRHGGQSGY